MKKLSNFYSLWQQKRELKRKKEEWAISDLRLELLEKQLERKDLSLEQKNRLTKIVGTIEAHKMITKMECIINNYKI